MKFPCFCSCLLLLQSAIVIQDVDINQGGVRNPDGSVCCPADAPQCKVQTVFQAGRQYFDYTHNRVSRIVPLETNIFTQRFSLSDLLQVC